MLFIYRCSSNKPTLSIYYTQVFDNVGPLLDNKSMVLSSNGSTLSIYHTQVFNNAVPLLDNKPMVLYWFYNQYKIKISQIKTLNDNSMFVETYF